MAVPTVLVSYSMTYTVGEVIESLKGKCANSDFVWWDLFSTPTRGKLVFSLLYSVCRAIDQTALFGDISGHDIADAWY